MSLFAEAVRRGVFADGMTERHVHHNPQAVVVTGVDDRLDEPSNEAVEADLMIACAYDPNDAWGEYSSDAMIAAWRAGYQNAQGRLRDAQAERDALLAQLGPCIGCNYNDGPEEFCPQHGRTYSNLLDLLGRVGADRDEARAALARVAALCDEAEGPGGDSIILTAGHSVDHMIASGRVRAAVQGDANPEATDG